MAESKMSLYGYTIESKANYDFLKKNRLSVEDLKKLDKDGNKKISDKELKRFDVNKIKSSAEEDELVEFEGDDFEIDKNSFINVASEDNNTSFVANNAEDASGEKTEKTEKGHKGKGPHKSGKSHGHHGHKKGDKTEGHHHGDKPSRKPSRKPGGDKRPPELDGVEKAGQTERREQFQVEEQEEE